jgi:hypothetical protein
MTTLLQAIRALAQQGSGAPGQVSTAFFEEGLVVSVNGVGGLTVNVTGKTVSAKPVTDEPFRANMKVWVSQSTEGWIVHGGKR